MANEPRGGIVNCTMDGITIPVYTKAEIQLSNLHAEPIEGLSGPLGSKFTPKSVKIDLDAVGIPAETLQRLASGQFDNVTLAVVSNDGTSYTLEGATVMGEVTKDLATGVVALSVYGNGWIISTASPATVAPAT